MLIFNVKNMKDKDALIKFLLDTLALQAYEQHRVRYVLEYKEWKHGFIVNRWQDQNDTDEEYIKFFIQYEDGTVYTYRHIDEGVEGMEIIKIEK